MKRFTDSIRKSVNNKNWYAAVAMALTLPDICGNIKWPKEASTKRSIRWFNESDLSSKSKFLKAENFYALRCSYIHEGSGNIESQRISDDMLRVDIIEPIGNGCSIGYNKFTTVEGKNILQVQADTFSIDVADAVDSWCSINKVCTDKLLEISLTSCPFIKVNA